MAPPGSISANYSSGGRCRRYPCAALGGPNSSCTLFTSRRNQLRRPSCGGQAGKRWSLGRQRPECQQDEWRRQRRGRARPAGEPSSRRASFSHRAGLAGPARLDASRGSMGAKYRSRARNGAGPPRAGRAGGRDRVAAGRAEPDDEPRGRFRDGLLAGDDDPPLSGVLIGAARHAMSCRVARQNLIDTRPERALVLFSGGQDSTTCLAWTLSRFAAVETIGFDYRQRHRVELQCRASVLETLRSEFTDWNGKLGVDHVVDLGVLGAISDTALTGDTAIAFEQNGLPNTFVPGRNLLFFTFAAAIGYRRGARHLVGHVRDRLFGLPRLPRRHPESTAGDIVARHGPSLCHSHPVDVARQGGDLGAGAGAWRGCARRTDPRGNPQLLPRRPVPPPFLGLWLR